MLWTTEINVVLCPRWVMIIQYGGVTGDSNSDLAHMSNMLFFLHVVLVKKQQIVLHVYCKYIVYIVEISAWRFCEINLIQCIIMHCPGTFVWTYTYTTYIRGVCRTTQMCSWIHIHKWAWGSLFVPHCLTKGIYDVAVWWHPVELTADPEWQCNTCW